MRKIETKKCLSLVRSQDIAGHKNSEIIREEALKTIERNGWNTCKECLDIISRSCHMSINRWMKMPGMSDRKREGTLLTLLTEQAQS
jgi:hypothetical protein